MGFNVLSKVIGGGIAEPIEAVGNALNKLFPSDVDKKKVEIVMERLRQQPQILQAEIGKLQAQHRSWFVAGARPFITWVCGLGLAFSFVINPILQWWTGSPGPEMPIEHIMPLIVAILGLGAYRSVEKFGNKTK